MSGTTELDLEISWYRAALAAALFGVLLWAPEASALEVEDVAVAYKAGGGCPDRATFVRELEASSAHVHATSRDDVARTFRVDVTNDPGGGAIARLTIEEANQPARYRTLHAADCDEAVRAVSFIAALAIDPSATPSTKAGSVAATESPPPAAWSGTPQSNRGAAAPPALLPKGPDAAGETNSAAIHAGKNRVRWSAGGGADVLSLGAPSAVPAWHLFVDALWNRHETLSPAARVGIVRTVESTVQAGPSVSAFTWTFARIELCPVRWGGRVAVAACAALDAGVVRATAESGDVREDHSRPWAASALEGRASFLVTPWLGIEAQGGLGVPWVREDFIYRPSPLVYRAPALMPFAGVSAVIVP